MSHDLKLQESVLAELSSEPSLGGQHIGVAARDGGVTLSGHVENFAEKHTAETAAARLRGLTAVAMAIDVRLPFDRQREDVAATAWAAAGTTDVVNDIIVV